ncbi:ribbon-helix-helix domain-containing protein [Psychrosphaera sp. B3R10]|uniref:ribbon-helix-helix domain-containing protein n=1 Tax=unclassified Psychrosphaera TaxID=2641570 RepID=UPI001C09D4C2|nr:MULTISPECIES: ribbon-helix-helix domain-containing protein [unclassified Psychrosphaera]MBU2880693.1 ribbon-helix-helix domain-containing protein [Psychrosphaera sp. I2R16]MBU2991561.1 ribbon-helix-helix domain-containing protein [Psychrosphaera sp. B3R10]MDO6719453.1 ribbon-helix-helix domain-containing protein [Psychrosphaera sp. 1_MG-2023]
MCRLFINADSQLWTYRTKSLRIDGVVTSIRLEEFFWDILEELSFRDQMSVNQMITKLYLESLDADHDISNFTSFLRVCCTRYLSLIADGDLSRKAQQPLADINSQEIMEQERLRSNQRKVMFGSREPKTSVN